MINRSTLAFDVSEQKFGTRQRLPTAQGGLPKSNYVDDGSHQELTTLRIPGHLIRATLGPIPFRMALAMNGFQGQLFSRGVLQWNAWRGGAGHSEIDLSGLCVVNQTLIGINLSNANLSGAKFLACHLHNASLKASNCRDSSFCGSVMHAVDMRDADFSYADLSRVHLADSIGNSRAKVSGASFMGTKFTTEEESQAEGSFLDLAMCEGLDEARFSHPAFLSQYLHSAFEFAQKPLLPERNVYPDLVDSAVGRIHSLVRLLKTEPPPQQLIEVCAAIDTEIIKFLQKRPTNLHHLSPRQFEYVIAEILASFGWEVQVTQQSKDGGYDIFAMTKDISGTKSAWIIECKKYKPESRVGIEVARSLYAIKGELRVSNAMLATTSHFTRGVQHFASSRYDLSLKDFESIVEWLNSYRPSQYGKLHIINKRLVVPRPGVERHHISGQPNW